MAKEVRVDAAQGAQKWGDNLKRATPYMTQGVERVRESPTLAAADKQDKMLTNLTEAIRSGKWARGLRRVSLQDWREAYIKKGIPRIAAGVDAAADKMRDFLNELFSFENTLLADIERMPDLTLEDSIARMTEWTRKMAGFERSA